MGLSLDLAAPTLVDYGLVRFCVVVVGGGGSDFGQVQLSPREGQIPDRFRQVWTGFRKNLPEPVRVPYLTKPGPNLTEGNPHFGGIDAQECAACRGGRAGVRRLAARWLRAC